MFAVGLEPEEQNFLERIKQFTPKKSFLELQKTAVNEDPSNDPFLSALARMRAEQESKAKEERRKAEMRQSSRRQYQDILTKEEAEEFEEYREEQNKQRAPIVPKV